MIFWRHSISSAAAAALAFLRYIELYTLVEPLRVTSTAQQSPLFAQDDLSPCPPPPPPLVCTTPFTSDSHSVIQSVTRIKITWWGRTSTNDMTVFTLDAYNSSSKRNKDSKKGSSCVSGSYTCTAIYRNDTAVMPSCDHLMNGIVNTCV